MDDGIHVSVMNEAPSQSQAAPELENKPSRAFMPYPVSTLSPPIVPTDLTSFKTRGISEVERELQQAGEFLGVRRMRSHGRNLRIIRSSIQCGSHHSVAFTNCPFTIMLKCR